MKKGREKLIRNIDERKNPDNLQNPSEEEGGGECKVVFLTCFKLMAKIGGVQLLQFSICYMTLYEFKKKCLLREKVGAPPPTNPTCLK